MSIKLYHATFARSLRVVWLLEEMGLAYELEKVKLALGETGGAVLAAVNPLQKVPTIEIDGEVLQESTAILEFVANRLGGEDMILPVNDPDYGRFLQWLHGGEAGFGIYISMYFGHTLLLPEEDRDPKMVAWSVHNLKKMLALFGDALGQRKFIAGDKFTIADISVGYICSGLNLVGQLENLAPKNVVTWYQSLAARPAFVKANSL
ncbi:MAG: glutathione S-transferase family protein [Robiginitomaculum sp.]|nr:glutathione S-transferase family protein [Robiginitomaculum sp.]